jgi:hypothetical protein
MSTSSTTWSGLDPGSVEVFTDLKRASALRRRSARATRLRL